LRAVFSIACGLLVVSLLAPQTPRADSVPAPRWNLSEEELWERAGFTSDGIVIATVDSTYEVEWPPNTAPPLERVAIHPLRWLKGHDARAHFAFQVFRDEGHPLLPPGMGPAAGGSPYLIFLKLQGPSWYLNTDVGTWNQGVVALSGEASSPYVGTIERVLRGQTLDSLTMSADLVVVGTPTQVPRGAPFADEYFRVERVVAGSTRDSVLPVTTPYFIDVMGKGRRLLFLHRWRAPDGTYEVVKSGAGSLALRGHSVERLGLDIDEVVRRVRRLKPAHARPRGVR
jgi:hypothetical protein